MRKGGRGFSAKVRVGVLPRRFRGVIKMSKVTSTGRSKIRVSRQSYGFHEVSLTVKGGGRRGGTRANLPGRAIEHAIFISFRGVPRATERPRKG